MFKKILAVLTVTVMLLSTMSAAFAERDWDCDFSVVAKPAPEPVPITVPGEEDVIAIIRDELGEVVAYVHKGELIVTAYSEKNKAEIPDITATLDAAYTQLIATPIADLNPDIAAYVNANAPEIDPNYLVVRDLFDARLVGDCARYLETPGNTIEIAFDAEIDRDCFLLVLSNNDIYEDSVWDIIPADKITRGTGGTVKITFDYLCPIVFSTKCLYAPDGTPPTGAVGYALLGIAVAVLGVGLIMFRKRSVKA